MAMLVHHAAGRSMSSSNHYNQEVHSKNGKSLKDNKEIGQKEVPGIISDTQKTDKKEPEEKMEEIPPAEEKKEERTSTREKRTLIDLVPKFKKTKKQDGSNNKLRTLLIGTIIIMAAIALVGANRQKFIGSKESGLGMGGNETLDGNATENVTIELDYQIEESGTIMVPGIGQDIPGTYMDIPFPVNNGSYLAFVNLTPSGGGPALDMDMVIIGANGREVTSSAGPTSDEAVVMDEKTFKRGDMGDYNARIYLYIGGAASFTLTVDMYKRADDNSTANDEGSEIYLDT